MKIVINACYGGFSISPEATLWLYEKGYKGESEHDKFAYPVEEYWGEQDPDKRYGKNEALKTWKEHLKNPNKRSMFLTVFSPCEKFVLSQREVKRDNPLLIECVETLGTRANGDCAKLKIVEIPDEVDWEIDEYDGYESIAEKHRKWS